MAASFDIHCVNQQTYQLMHHTINKDDVKSFLGSRKYTADNDIFFISASVALAHYGKKACIKSNQPPFLTSINNG
jgi:hypothetical protein